MLTAHQVEVVAFVADGGIICREHAVERYGELGVAAIEEGIAEFLPSDVSPLIRYELDSYWSEELWERAVETVDDRLDGRWPELRDRLVDREFERHTDEGYPCGVDGKEIL